LLGTSADSSWVGLLARPFNGEHCQLAGDELVGSQNTACVADKAKQEFPGLKPTENSCFETHATFLKIFVAIL